MMNAKCFHNRDWLWEHYIVREESTCTIAQEAKCDPTTISNWLRKLGISIRDRGNLWRNRDWLCEHYIARKESAPIMAGKAQCDPMTINYWLHKYEIPVRSPGEGSFITRKNSVIIIPDLLEFMKGEILGDGHVGMPSNRSAFYAHGSKYEEYLIWLSGYLDKWGIEQAGRITRHISKKSGTIFYSYASRSYPELVPIYRAWYSKRDGKMKKTVPKDLKLTPIMARQWHLGDGHLGHPKCGRPYIMLSTDDFDHPSVGYLVKELSRLGFKATRQPSSNKIRISAHSTKEFLDWIGPCPIACYDYRWDYDKNPKNREE